MQVTLDPTALVISGSGDPGPGPLHLVELTVELDVGAGDLDGEQPGFQVVVSVADDGRGGAVARPGSGLAGLVDRVEAAGGELLVESTRAGTALTAVLPCE